MSATSTLDPRDAANPNVANGLFPPMYRRIPGPGYANVGGKIVPIPSPGVDELPRMASFWVAVDSSSGAPASAQILPSTGLVNGALAEVPLKLTHCVNRNGMVARQDAPPNPTGPDVPFPWAVSDFDVQSEIVRFRYPGVWMVRAHIVIDGPIPNNFLRASLWWTPNWTENPTDPQNVQWIRMATETLSMQSDHAAAGSTGLTLSCMVGTAHEMLPANPPVPLPGETSPALGPALKFTLAHYGPSGSDLVLVCGAQQVTVPPASPYIVLGCRLDVIHQTHWHGKDDQPPVGTPPLAPGP